ncbi:ribosome assembly cofactor RimP [Mucilaginibacter sp. HMF5004]|uniref:ribosome assembly cofactor RimP n=1 Tax=Mucilaginibacter rivuli TaxID=2857527 RepID=UPI001C5EE69B|nr:ribosome assembly cofactor RimP [Mucilaginibacter rivuli]MBW4888445.1 ribosome assembly cofactor RimP [Mucilaginibacter rivuli]
MSEKKIEQRVAMLVEEKIADRPDLFLVEIKMLPSRKLMILVDGDNGIGIADCAAISRFVGFKLEEEEVIAEAYNLEVSSPGIDSPLILPRQYTKNVGRNLGIKMLDGAKREGTLKSIDNDNIIIEEKVKAAKGKKVEVVEATIPLSEVAETKVLISFK